MGEFLTTEDDHFIVQCSKFLTMGNGDVVDERSRISPRKHKALLREYCHAGPNRIPA